MTEFDPPEGNEDPTWIDSAAIRANQDEQDAPGETNEQSQNLDSPRRLGDFELLQEIGRGGMGVVWEARQVSLNRRVALKVLPPALGMSGDATQRFVREAKAAAKLHHTNIVPVYAIGEDHGTHFYAMELIEGQSLDQVVDDLARDGSNRLFESSVAQTHVKDSPDAPARVHPDEPTSGSSEFSSSRRDWFDTVARLTAEVADALHYAHSRGVIHRDIKPANLMLSTEGRLCVTDFGLARMLQEPGLTVSGSLMGTPAYMSPEQVAGGRVGVDHRTDIYSLGAVLYEVLTLKHLFSGESREQVLSGVLTKEARQPRRINPRIPIDLETICLKAIEKDPDRRYASAEELAQDLRRYQQRGLILGRRAGPLRRLWKLTTRHPVAAMAIVSVLLLAAVAVTSWRLVEAERARGSVNRSVTDARIDLSAGLYRDGLEKIDSALAIEPESAEARLIRARLLIELDRRGNAIDEARDVLEQHPDDWTAHLMLASAAGGTVGRARYPQIDIQEHIRFVEDHAPESAEAYYLRSIPAQSAQARLELLGKAIALDPGHANALVERINLNKDVLMDFPAAIQDCESLIIARSRSAEGRRMLARVHVELAEYDDALAEIERAILLDPDDSHNYPVRAEIYRETGRLEEAIADLTHAIELAPDSVLHRYQRAVTRNRAGRFEASLQDSRRAIELNQDFEPAYREMLLALQSLDRMDALETTLLDLREATEGWEDRRQAAAAYRTAAHYYRVLKDYPQAASVAERAVELEPESYRGYILLGLIGRDAGDESAYLSDCEIVAGLETGDPRERIDRGWDLAFDCSDRWDDSLVDFEASVTAFPNWFTAYHRRGTAYFATNRNDEALADFARSIELAPRYIRNYIHRAAVYEAMNRIEDSLADHKRTLELDPHTSPASYWGLGNAYFSAGSYEDAVALYDAAIAIDPLSPHAFVLRAGVLPYLGRCDAATRDILKARELTTTGHADDRGSAFSNLALVYLNSLYYNCPGDFDASAALEIAQTAFENGAEKRNYTLGYALLRLGRFDEARTALETAYEEDAPNVTFPLAICLWNLGEKSAAQTHFERSRKWMDETGSRAPVFHLQRREAAGLMGLTDSGA